MAKQRRKKYNSAQGNMRLASAGLQHHALCHVQGRDKDVVCYHAITGKEIPVGPLALAVIKTQRFKWAVLLVVYRRESNGKLGEVTDWIRLGDAYTEQGIREWVVLQHYRLVQTEVNKGNEVIDIGFAAMPAPPRYVDDDTDEKLCRRLLAILNFKFNINE